MEKIKYYLIFFKINILFVIALFISILAWSDTEDNNLTYLACDFGEVKVMSGKYKPGPHSLDKLLNNKIKLPKIAALRKHIRVYKGNYKEIDDRYYLPKELTSFRYRLITIQSESENETANICSIDLKASREDGDENCNTFKARDSAYLYSTDTISTYTSHYLDRVTLVYNYRYKNKTFNNYSGYAFQCNISSLDEWNKIKIKFKEAKEPLYQVIEEKQHEIIKRTEEAQKVRKI
tara:strand:- start:58 stop:762 length:705 start_codon:yes stop_codon:yes gene_type:complete